MSTGGEHVFAIFVCFVIAILAVFVTWHIFETRASLRHRPRERRRKRPAGRHARLFADPADDTDPDGEKYIADLHDDDPPAGGYLPAPLPVPGRLALEPVPPPAETRPQPVIKDVAACELGMSVQDYVDGVFAPAEASLDAMAARYAEVTR